MGIFILIIFVVLASGIVGYSISVMSNKVNLCREYEMEISELKKKVDVNFAKYENQKQAYEKNLEMFGKLSTEHTNLKIAHEALQRLNRTRTTINKWHTFEPSSEMPFSFDELRKLRYSLHPDKTGGDSELFRKVDEMFKQMKNKSG